MLDKIKKELDPEHSYLIFEKSSGLDEEADFHSVFTVLREFEHAIYERTLVKDESTGRVFLILKLYPTRPDNLLEKVLQTGISDKITCYAYGTDTRQ